MTTIPLFFTFDEHYVVPALVAFHSLLAHADRQYRYRLHVLHPGISDRARRRIASVVGRFDHGEVVFHDTSMYDAELASCGGKSHFSKEIYFKLCAPTLFPECDRIICSDVDVVFTGDVSKAYFAYPDEDFYYAGVDTILPTNRLPLYASFDKEEQHWLAREICANFLLLNLKALRRDDMQRRMTEYYKANYARLPFPEQDCMAICARGQVRPLSMRYGVSNVYYRVNADTTPFYAHCLCLPADDAARRAEFKAALADPIQLHYIGAEKPWNSCGVPKQTVWLRTLWEAGQTMYYIRCLPGILRQKWRRYSFRRFIGKLMRKIKQ